jgi:hypothetical protein
MAVTKVEQVRKVVHDELRSSFPALLLRSRHMRSASFAVTEVSLASS